MGWDDEEEEEAAPRMLVLTMGKALDKYSGRINAHPVAWWGDPDEPDHELLKTVFSAERTLMRTSRVEIEGEATRISTTLRHQSAGHAAVLESPKAFADARDAQTGVTALHGCAFNGYLDTMRLLVEKGGADITLETTVR
jgi:hypothetical protein